jgi:predicted RNA binding protein with dsRBD fold (UPF0201 family)
MAAKISIKVTAKLFPTESEETVRSALYVVFPNLTFERTGSCLAATSETPYDLAHLKRLLSEKRILDTARSRLLQFLARTSTKLLLHKQALAAGKVAIVDSPDESPLGAIEISIETDTLPDFINYLAPRTVDGAPIDEETLENLGFQDS